MSRRFAWFTVAILAAIGLYTAGGFYIAHRLEDGLARSIADVRSSGGAADCTQAEARGYPFRIGLFCDGVAYSDAARGLAIQGKGLRSAAQIYQPAKVVGELDTLSIDLRRAGVEIDASDIRYSTHVARPLPEIASVAGRSVTANVIGGERLTTAQTAEAHMRPRGNDIDLAGKISALRFEPGSGVPREVPPLDAEWDLTVADGVARVRNASDSLRGLSGEIRTLLARSDNASLSVSGPVRIGADGLVDADLTVSVTDAAALVAIVRTAFPHLSGQLGQAEVLLTAMGDNPKVPVGISKGVVRIAFFTLGRIPPLD